MEVRPIDANALLDNHFKAITRGEFGEELDVILTDVVRTAPTLDYEPVVHAHWIQEGFDCKCSNCGSFNGAFGVKYCQDCGAKMDEEVKG